MKKRAVISLVLIFSFVVLNLSFVSAGQQCGPNNKLDLMFIMDDNGIGTDPCPASNRCLWEAFCSWNLEANLSSKIPGINVNYRFYAIDKAKGTNDDIATCRYKSSRALWNDSSTYSPTRGDEGGEFWAPASQWVVNNYDWRTDAEKILVVVTDTDPTGLKEGSCNGDYDVRCWRTGTTNSEVQILNRTVTAARNKGVKIAVVGSLPFETDNEKYTTTYLSPIGLPVPDTTGSPDTIDAWKNVSNGTGGVNRNYNYRINPTNNLTDNIISMIDEVCVYVPECRNGILDIGEECDDGNDNNNDACRNDCTLPHCGDGIVDSGEECDDGNINNNDACKNDCTNNICGDNVIYTGIEECDDGNQVNNDGCSSTCLVEECTSLTCDEIKQDEGAPDVWGDWPDTRCGGADIVCGGCDIGLPIEDKGSTNYGTCQIFDQCSDYTIQGESACNNAPQSIGIATVEAENPNINCGLNTNDCNYECECEFNSNNQCVGSWIASDCPDDSDNGQCMPLGGVVTKSCDEEPIGTKKISMTYNWTGLAENKPDSCIDGIKEYKCISRVELNFFDNANLIIVIIILVIFYLIVIRNKKKYSEKIQVRKKKK